MPVLMMFCYLNIAELIGYQFGFIKQGFGHIGMVMTVNPVVGLQLINEFCLLRDEGTANIRTFVYLRIHYMTWHMMRGNNLEFCSGF